MESNNMHIYYRSEEQDSSVDIVTRYGMEGPGFESRCRRNYPHIPDRPWGKSSPLYESRVFPRGKGSVRGVCHTHTKPSSTEVKERVQLYLYSLSGSSWPVMGQTFTFTITIYNRSDLAAAKLLRKIIHYKNKDRKLSEKQLRI